MKNTKLICIAMAFMLAFSAIGFFNAVAETQPLDTNPVVTEPLPPATTAPATTEPVTPPQTNATEGNTSSGEVVTTAPAPVEEPTTQYVRPTEYEDEPNTYSNYVSPPPVYTPNNDQDFDKVEWEEIKLDINAGIDGKNPPVGDFSNIKNNNSKGDEQNYVLLIVGIILIALSLAGITFAILYKPKAAAAKAGRGAKAPKGNSVGRYAQSKKPAAGGTGEKNTTDKAGKADSRDDYNDGY